MRWPRISRQSEQGHLPQRIEKSTAVVNGRSLNVRVPMKVVRSVWPHVEPGSEFHFAAYPKAGLVVLQMTLNDE